METFTETRKNKVHSWTTEITVERTPTTLSEHRMLRHRWFDYVADHITECFNVKVTMSDKFDRTYTETFFEFVTPYGRGCVMMFQGRPESTYTESKSYSEIDVFIPNVGKAYVHGFWKKYGKSRGHAMGYARANKLNVDSRAKVEHTCPAVIYAAAVGKKYGA